MYGPQPYLYRAVEDCFIVYEADRAGVEELPPPGLNTVSTVAPWHLLAPEKVLECHFGVYDFDLPHGRVIHDYLEDEEVWEGIESGAAVAV